MAGERAADMLDPLLQGQRVAPFLDLIGEIADQRFDIEPRDERRHLAHDDRARSERLQHEAELRQLVGPRRDPSGECRVKLDDLGEEQDLPRDAVPGERFLHALIDEPLMRGMLIDEHDAGRGLGQDIGAVQLRPGGSKREIRRRIRPGIAPTRLA